jgi:hypothetical protein
MGLEKTRKLEECKYYESYKKHIVGLDVFEDVAKLLHSSTIAGEI